MAKKEKKQNANENENEEKRGIGSRILAVVIGIIIVLVWLAIFGVLIKLDVGGFGSSILRPLLKNVPVVNKILPSASDSQVAYENDYPYKSLEDAIAKIDELEAENKKLTENKKTDSQTIKELKAEVKRLKVFEKNQTAFEKRVKEFDENVVFNDSAPSIEEYKKYYESINPTTAEEIYRQVVEQLQYSDAIQEKADIYSKMKPAAAASILQNMTADIDLVAKMLLCMKPDQSSLILAQMNSTMAAKITKKMFDLDQDKQSSTGSSESTDTGSSGTNSGN